MPRHPDPVVTVEVPIGAYVDRPDALHAALLCWLEQEERKTAGRDHMLKIRALTKPQVRTDTA